MRNIYLTIISVLISLASNAQIEEYFLPSSEYFDKEFLFESEKWENEKGLFQVKNRVRYFKDPTGNFKNYIENAHYRYNAIEMTMKVHRFYHVSKDNVTMINSYIEGVSEELKQYGFIDDFNTKETIMKRPPASWSISGKNQNYKAEYGRTKTEYGDYNDCIVVTEVSRIKSPETKKTVKYTTKSYYAKSLGLIKTENFKNGKPIKEEFGFGGTLIDNFSEYSIYVAEKRRAAELAKEQERVQEELRKKAEAERNRRFLIERQTKTYNYSTVDYSSYTSTKSALEREFNKIISNNSNLNFDLEFAIDLRIDTLRRVSRDMQFVSGDSSIYPEFQGSLSNVRLSPVYMNGYTVNAKMNEKFKVSNKPSQRLKIKSSKSSFTLKRGDDITFTNNQSYLKGQLSGYDKPFGTYSIVYSESAINGKKQMSIKYENYKSSLGGPIYGAVSLVIPGLGNHFVNGGSGSMLGENISPWVTTVGALALVGSGVGLRSSSQKNYDKYLNATKQDEIDEYYEKANTQNKRGYILIGIGAGVWLADIIWTTAKGVQNKKKESEIKRKLNIALYPNSNTNGLDLSLSLKFD